MIGPVLVFDFSLDRNAIPAAAFSSFDVYRNGGWLPDIFWASVAAPISFAQSSRLAEFGGWGMSFNIQSTLGGLAKFAAR
jgi:hypothetical protein